MNNERKTIYLYKDSERNEVSRYKCTVCDESQIVAFNEVGKANFNYCPMCGCKIIIEE